MAKKESKSDSKKESKNDSKKDAKKSSKESGSSGEGVAKSNSWMVATIVLGVLLFVSLMANAVFGTLLFVSSSGDSVAAPSPSPAGDSGQPQQAPSEPVEVSVDDDPVKGDADAPVTMIEFSDYECPFCQRFYNDALQQIESEYIQTGQVKMVYRDFPLSFHARAMPAAIAAECVQELEGDETYFEYHDALFEGQNDLSDAALRSRAVDVGVDGAAFDECYADEDGEMRSEVQADMSDGQAAGVSGTPTVFINGQKIVGAQPYSAFKSAIDAALNE